MNTRRQVQVADAIQQHMSDLLQRELKDPGIGFTTVTRVEVSQDLKYARVYVSVMGSPEEQKSTMAALDRGRGFIRREIGQRLDLRAVPEINFRLDTSAEYSDRINRLLNELKVEEAGKAPEGNASGDGSENASQASPETSANPQQEETA